MNKYTEKIKEEKLIRLFFDLDDTLAEQIWPEEGIGQPIKENVELVRKLHKKGYRIWVYTTRPDYDFINIENWAKDNDIPIGGILCGKPLGKVFVDDRAVNPFCKECVKRLSEL